MNIAHPARHGGWGYGCVYAVLFVLASLGAAGEEADAQRVAEFLDPLVAQELAAAGIPGAVVTVVHGGETVYSRGFGTAVLGRDVPVDPATTLFRVASLSKLFTATAVMQLFEQGKVDLHADVNRYLTEFKLPATYPAPVTLENLLTHTAGFDDRFLGAAARTFDEMVPLGAYLSRRMPPRVLPPGTVQSYSNHGMALAGHLVEEVSGLPFADYVKKNIFAPLGMDHSDFLLVPDGKTPLAQGYNYYLGAYHPALYDYPLTVPASTLTVTGGDMARFMIAHLRGGAYGEGRILREETVRLMHARHFAHHPALEGMAYGFEERIEHGQRMLQHTGLIWGFASLVLLMPESDTGLFISSNTDSGRLYSVISARFLDHFLPKDAEEKAPAVLPAGAVERIRKACGHYRSNRYCRSTFIKFGVMIPRFVAEINVSPGVREGILAVHWTGGGTWHFQEVAPNLFQGVHLASGVLSPTQRAFLRTDAAGRVLNLCINGSAYEPIGGHETRGMLTAALGTSLLIMISALLAWPITRRICRRRGGTPLPAGIRRARACAFAACALCVLFALGFLVFLGFTAMNPNSVGYGAPPLLIGVLVLPLLALPPALLLVPCLAWLWLPGRAGFLARLHYTAVCGAAWVFLALLHYWNLLGFQFGGFCR